MKILHPREASNLRISFALNVLLLRHLFLSDVLAAVHLLLDAVALLLLVAHVHLGGQGEVVVQELAELHQLHGEQKETVNEAGMVGGIAT